jgi:hypothetical protein
MVLGSDQAGKDFQSTTRKYDVVKSSSKRLASAFDDAQAPTLRAIFWCDFFEMNDAMRDTVGGPLRGLGG